MFSLRFVSCPYILNNFRTRSSRFEFFWYTKVWCYDHCSRFIEVIFFNSFVIYVVVVLPVIFLQGSWKLPHNTLFFSDYWWVLFRFSQKRRTLLESIISEYLISFLFYNNLKYRQSKSLYPRFVTQYNCPFCPFCWFVKIFSRYFIIHLSH
jgi:hypothetical protein